MRRGKLTAKQNRQLHQFCTSEANPREPADSSCQAQHITFGALGLLVKVHRPVLGDTLPLQGPFLFWWCSRGAATS